MNAEDVKMGIYSLNERKRNTLILMGVVIGIALLLSVPRIISSISGTGGPENALEVVVAIDGQEAAVFPLSGSEDVIIDGYQGGFNHLVIKDGEAVLTEADCPDRRCTRMGPISEPGEWMVCLPHRVTVTIR